MEENKKYYTRSNGEQVDISTMETTHIKNAWSKKLEDLFTSKNKTEFANKLKEVNDLKEEYHARLNKYYDTLGDE